MLLSEEEAKGRWCSFSRVARREMIDPHGIAPRLHLVPGINRNAFDGQLVPGSCLCLASGCMSWRWAGYQIGRGSVSPEPTGDPRSSPRLGYCGLAGKPHGAP